MMVYVSVLILFYLAGVAADYKTTKINLAAGKDEINPAMQRNTTWRVLFPFLYALPVFAFFIAIEHSFLESGQYINERASLVYETEVFYAQIASLVVFFVLVVGSSKAVASISNIFIMFYGRGLPDLVGSIIGWKSTSTIFIVTSLVSLVVVIPLVYVVRYITFAILI